jgi:hypothetical protein
MNDQYKNFWCNVWKSDNPNCNSYSHYTPGEGKEVNDSSTEIISWGAVRCFIYFLQRNKS